MALPWRPPGSGARDVKAFDEGSYDQQSDRSAELSAPPQIHIWLPTAAEAALKRAAGPPLGDRGVKDDAAGS
ncbi:MAG TPA: hypothetical protein VFB81_10380 [Myxococcales bacterium]|nr:hypothetical protein [Myxococcales bacterium]